MLVFLIGAAGAEALRQAVPQSKCPLARLPQAVPKSSGHARAPRGEGIAEVVCVRTTCSCLYTGKPKCVLRCMCVAFSHPSPELTGLPSI